MPAPKMTQLTDTFRTMNRDGTMKGDTNFCGVVAIAAVTGLTFDEADARLGRKFRDGTPVLAMKRVLKEQGLAIVEVHPDEFIAAYPKPHCNALKNVTTHHPDRFPAAWADGTYILFTNNYGHTLAVTNGENHDWTRGKAKRVTTIWKIIGADE